MFALPCMPNKLILRLFLLQERRVVCVGVRNGQIIGREILFNPDCTPVTFTVLLLGCSFYDACFIPDLVP
jgi:hypothetical protein